MCAPIEQSVAVMAAAVASWLLLNGRSTRLNFFHDGRTTLALNCRAQHNTRPLVATGARPLADLIHSNRSTLKRFSP